MDLTALHSRVREIQFNGHGLDAVVSRPGHPNITTRIIWLTPITDGRPAGADLARNEAVRVMAIRRDHVPDIPRGTTVVVTEHLLSEPTLWKVDSAAAIFSDHHRVVVVPE